MARICAHSRGLAAKRTYGYLVCKMKENKEAAKGRVELVRHG